MMNLIVILAKAGVIRSAISGGETKADPTANCDLRSKKVVRAKDRHPRKGRAA